METQELLTRLAVDKSAIQSNFSQERITTEKKILELKDSKQLFELLSSNGVDTLLDCSEKMAAHELIQKSQVDICKRIFSCADFSTKIANFLAKGNSTEIIGIYNAFQKLTKSLENYPLVYDFAEKKEFDDGLIRVENQVSGTSIDQAGYIQKWKNAQGEYELREVLPMRSVVNNREFLTCMDSDGIILEGLKQSIGIVFYLAKQENDGKINVKIINRIEGRGDPFRFVGSGDPYKFVDGELHIKNDQYGDIIVKKIRDENGKFVALKFFQHREFCKDKEIFF